VGWSARSSHPGSEYVIVQCPGCAVTRRRHACSRG
jgi:hypothetical protein